MAAVPASVSFTLPAPSSGVCFGYHHQKLARHAKRIVLVQHAESTAQVNPDIYGHLPDWKVPLTKNGDRQAAALGPRLEKLAGASPMFFYVSPYERAKQTYIRLRDTMSKGVLFAGAKEEPRLADQQLGNYQNAASRNELLQLRRRYGKFYFRYREGESAADVYNRGSSFVESMTHDISTVSQGRADMTLVMVTHGLTIRCLLMRLFDMSVDDFESMVPPSNATMIVLSRGPDNTFRLDPDSILAVRFPELKACRVHGEDCRVGRLR